MSGTMTGSKRKNKKQYYVNAKKFKYSTKLNEGMRGFLITCNFREKEAVREAYNLLNQYSDDMYGPEVFVSEQVSNVEEESNDDASDEEDIEAALEKEKNKLKNSVPKKRRFQQVVSGAKNCCFIKTTLENPAEIVEKIVQESFEQKQQKARYILRLIPVLGTCKVDDECITGLAKRCLKNIFVGDKAPQSYCIMIKVINNQSIVKKDTILLVASAVRELNKDVSVEYKDPDLVVIVEIIRTICCIGVARGYYRYKKYNLVEMVKPTTIASVEPPADNPPMDDPVAKPAESGLDDNQDNESPATEGQEGQTEATTGNDEAENGQDNCQQTCQSDG